MIRKPENWDKLDSQRKIDFIFGKYTGVCHCNISIGESCKKCDTIPNIPFDDRNFHEELILLLYGWAKESKDADPYWMYLNFVEFDDEEQFNEVIKIYFMSDDTIVNTENEDEFDNAWCNFHKSIRQCDYYCNLKIVDTVKKITFLPVN